MEFVPSCATNSLGTANSLLNTFVTTIFALHCNISSPDIWPEDYGETAAHYGVEDFDFIVIGAGAAGSVVAARLAENIDNKILLVEAGGDPPMESKIPSISWTFFGSEIDWNFNVLPSRDYCLGTKSGHCTWHGGKVIGGTHSIGVRAYNRGNPRDYNIWEDFGNPSWGWNGVLEYFKKTEKYRGPTSNPYGLHGTSGPLNVEAYRVPKTDRVDLLKIAEELGHPMVEDFTDGPYIGFGRHLGTLDNGRGVTTAEVFLTKKQPNLYVMKHSVARKIRFDKSLRARSVSVVYKNRYRLEIQARKEIIVSAGVLGSPKLLMLSGVGPKTHLEALGIPVVKDCDAGRNLQDHVRVEIFYKLTPEKKEDPTIEFLDGFYDHWVHRKGPFGAGDIDLMGYIATDGDPIYPDILYHFVQQDNFTTLSPSSTYTDHIAQSVMSQVGPTDKLYSASIMLLRVESIGFTKLRSADYRDDPLIHHNYFDKKIDMRRMVRGIENLVELEKAPTWRKLKGEFLRPYLPDCDSYPYRSRKYWECYARFMSVTCLHTVGSLKMGPRKDESAVVNSKLQVNGVKGLSVIDASIMPRIVSANPLAPTIMIAEKGADFIKRRWNL